MEPLNHVLHTMLLLYLDLSAERDVEDCPLPVAVVIVVVVCAPVLSGYINGMDIELTC